MKAIVKEFRSILFPILFAFAIAMMFIPLMGATVYADTVTLSGTVDASSLVSGNDYKVSAGTEIVLAAGDDVTINSITGNGEGASLTIRGAGTGTLTVNDGILLADSGNKLLIQGGKLVVNKTIDSSCTDEWNYATYVNSYEQTGGTVTTSITNANEKFTLAFSSPDFTISNGNLNCIAKTTGTVGSSWGLNIRGDSNISGGKINCTAESTNQAYGIQCGNADISGGEFVINSKTTDSSSFARGFYVYTGSDQRFKIKNAKINITIDNSVGTAYGIQTTSLDGSISACDITANVKAKGDAYGFISQTNGLDLNVSGGSLDITANSEEAAYGIYTKENISFADDCSIISNAVSTGTGDGGVSYGITAPKNFSITSNSSVTATATGNGASDAAAVVAVNNGPYTWNINKSALTAQTTSNYVGTGGIYGIRCDQNSDTSKVTINDSILTATCNATDERAYGAVFSSAVTVSGASLIDVTANGNTEATGFRTSKALTISGEDAEFRGKVTLADSSSTDTYPLWVQSNLIMNNHRITTPVGGVYEGSRIKDGYGGANVKEVIIEPKPKRTLYASTYSNASGTDEYNNAYGNSTNLLIRSDRAGDTPQYGGRTYQVIVGNSITVTASVDSPFYQFVGWYENNKNGAELSTNPSYTYTMGDVDYSICAKFIKVQLPINELPFTTAITDIAEGQTAGTPTVTLPDEVAAKVNILNVYWVDTAEGKTLESTDTFEKDKVYRLCIACNTADLNYKWGDTVTATLNGAALKEYTPGTKGLYYMEYMVRKNNTINVSTADATVTGNVAKAVTFTRAATATSGTVKYASSQPKYVTVNSSGNVTIAKNWTGTAVITVTSPESLEYKAAPAKSYTIKVKPGKMAVKSATNVKTRKIKVAWAR